ncbi:hypothetical protein PYCCODRAFT_1429713 [Trametes coccinea BRFM310]|uniref:Uncharacterized protein n=1 Tax=Trametes coccinea (strain BRFM310) TaxID=1353009 RepID=A0A1Y2J8U5_TRAC3|nr:hypothetical protein PYCCODRAFT_1429713 [Trametes coccinea BRFM310]
MLPFLAQVLHFDHRPHIRLGTRRIATAHHDRAQREELTLWSVVPNQLDDTGRPMWYCNVCGDYRMHRTRNKTQHERGLLHQSLLERMWRQAVHRATRAEEASRELLDALKQR